MTMTLQGQQSLEDLLQQLYAILRSIPVLESRAYRPPIICGDAYAQYGDSIIGLRMFNDAVSKEVEILEQFLARSDQGSELSTNASYFVALWNEILAAPPPILAIGKFFNSSSPNEKNAAAGSVVPNSIKVDIVAGGGRKWIRVNTMKNSRILAEFREIDSYLTGSEDDSSADELFERPTDQDNSLLRMGRALAAASAIPIPGTNEKPSVTLRLTRLRPEPSDKTDPRIALTVDALKSLGLEVQLGERTFKSLNHDDRSHHSVSQSPMPTSRINLDLSMLIALVSDLTHAELPEHEDGAWSRFRSSDNARPWKLGESDTGDGSRKATDSEEGKDFSKHSRALSIQCIQEMAHGLIEEVVGPLKSISNRNEVTEFWTTEEARRRCLQIVDKIGGKDEKRRARALFGGDSELEVSHCREEFWRGSRYPQSYFPALPPIHIHASRTSRVPSHVSSLFWGQLIQTCRRLLSPDASPCPTLYPGGDEMERAKVTKVNPKLTVHTVESMLIGACEGMTTLTANKTSVKALLREMKGMTYGLDGGPSIEVTLGSFPEVSVAAALWIVEPRSLAEGMRADHLLYRNRNTLENGS